MTRELFRYVCSQVYYFESVEEEIYKNKQHKRMFHTEVVISYCQILIASLFALFLHVV